MKKFKLLFGFLLIMTACTVDEGVMIEQTATVAEATAVNVSPTSDTPRLNEEPVPPTAVPTDPPDLIVVAETPTDLPATPTPLPTATAVPAETTESVEAVSEEESSVIYGRTPQGAFFHGDPNAPITMIDYSDFL